ncbi:hypothetical protein BSKO_13479 [Bryopsis sp. KO-2023]|nr:hypothetical protein BSKO_13479 [Bryopsis sp. KO-2023]
MGNSTSTFPIRDDPVQLKKLSVVIPALNEEKNIGNTLNSLKHHGLDNDPEVIVVDGDSTDDTPRIVKQCGAQVVSSARGRGVQLNAGWKKATGDWVLFLHADSLLPPGYGAMIERELSNRKAPIWGCFEGIKTDISGWSMRVVEWGVRARTRWLHMPYGDQAVFIDRHTLTSMHGFKTYPLLEDVDMVRRLGAIAAPAIVPASVTTSGRRWEKVGVWQTMVLNQCVIMGYHLGVDIGTLSRLYESTGVRRSKS